MYHTIAILAGFAVLYSAISGRIERSTISAAIIFTAFGLVAGPVGLGWVETDAKASEIKGLAEYTLGIILFADAANADLSVLRRSYRIPQRLLGIGLPLTIALGFGVGVGLFPGLALLEIAVLATMLAPTDAALGRPVVTNERVPSPRG